MPVTRLPDGIGTVAGDHIHGDWPLPYVPGVHQHLEEFDVFHRDVAPSTDQDWMTFLTGAGSITPIDAANGIVRLTTDGTDQDEAQIQYSFEDIDPDAGLLSFACGLEISTPSPSANVVIGLANNAGAASFRVTEDGYLLLPQPDGEIIFVVKSGGTTVFTLDGIGPWVVDEFFSMQFTHDPETHEIFVGFNGQIQAQGTLHGSGQHPTGLLCLSANILADGVVTVSQDIDYMWVGNARGYAT